ncbi:MAG TPA: MFS transporter, partial [Turneriella sp.]|nr:MFS transporter [Turneriella sp.]
MRSSRATTSFIFVTLLLDIIGFGLVIPVMPKMVARFTTNDIETNNWYMVMTASYGIMQFFFSPILGALSDKFGRRPILLLSIVGLGCN